MKDRSQISWYMMPDSLGLFFSGQASFEGALEPAGTWSVRKLLSVNLREPLQIQLGFE